MIPSPTASLKLLAAAGLLLVAAPAPELRVLRVFPAEDASPTAAVTITFDRPVAGSLDRTVDPKGIFRIEPSLVGHGLRHRRLQPGRHRLRAVSASGIRRR